MEQAKRNYKLWARIKQALLGVAQRGGTPYILTTRILLEGGGTPYILTTRTLLEGGGTPYILTTRTLLRVTALSHLSV